MKYKRGLHPNSLKNLTGRKRGSKNKFTTLKQSFLNAFIDMGGEETLTAWGKENKTEFYRLLAKLLPRQIDIGVTLEDVLGAFESAGLDKPVRDALVRIVSARQREAGRSDIVH